jgi:hypothetical protein
MGVSPQAFYSWKRRYAGDAVQAPRLPDIEMKPVEEERAGELILSAEGTEMFLPILDGALYRNAPGARFSLFIGAI